MRTRNPSVNVPEHEYGQIHVRIWTSSLPVVIGSSPAGQLRCCHGGQKRRVSAPMRDAVRTEGLKVPKV